MAASVEETLCRQDTPCFGAKARWEADGKEQLAAWELRVELMTGIARAIIKMSGFFASRSDRGWIMGFRFAVALSFPGEYRDYVEQVDQAISQWLPPKKVFYDNRFVAEFAGFNGDEVFQKIYHDQAELIVVFLCKEYKQKKWCYNVEWRAIRELIATREDMRSILPLGFGPVEKMPGIFSKVDIVLDISKKSPGETAELVWKRLQLLRGKTNGTTGGREGSTDPLLPLSELPRGQFNSASLSSFTRMLKTFVIEDQIRDSGGWAVSQERIFKYNYGKSPKAIEKREGGIVSTYIAVRALRAAGIDMNSHTAPGHAAAAYLSKRRTNDGAFGRFNESRGIELIRPSFRHTALACLALMTLDGPPNIVIQSIRHMGTVTANDFQHDEAPSIARAAWLLAMQCASSEAWGQRHLPATEVAEVRELLANRKAELLLDIESEAKSLTQPYSPLWEPYGHRPRMVHDSALTTVDLLSLLTDAPWDVIITALSHLAKTKVEHGLPYDPSLSTADLGVSTYFAVICRRRPVFNKLKAAKVGKEILAVADQCFQFSFAKWGETEYMSKTYCDTAANGLLLRLK